MSAPNNGRAAHRLAGPLVPTLRLTEPAALPPCPPGPPSRCRDKQYPAPRSARFPRRSRFRVARSRISAARYVLPSVVHPECAKCACTFAPHATGDEIRIAHPPTCAGAKERAAKSHLSLRVHPAQVPTACESAGTTSSATKAAPYRQDAALKHQYRASRIALPPASKLSDPFAFRFSPPTLEIPQRSRLRSPLFLATAHYHVPRATKPA